MYHILRNSENKILNELLRELSEIDRRETAQGRNFLENREFRIKTKRLNQLVHRLGLEG